MINNFILSICDSCVGGLKDGWFFDWFYSPDLVFGIKKYAICLLGGIIAAYIICTKEGEKMGIKKDDVLQIVVIGVPLCILGARIYYMLTDGIDTFGSYKDEGFFKAIGSLILECIGFSNYGGKWQFVGISGIGMFGVIVVAFIMVIVACKWKKWKITNFLDMASPGLLIGQVVGRWGNFFNREAHGTVVGGWSIKVDALGNEVLVANLTQAEQYDRLVNTFHIPKFIANNMCMSDEVARVSGDKWMTLSGYNYYHPTFLYEMLLNLVGLILYFIFRRTKFVKSGQFAAGYMIWYGIVRILIEILRTDALYIGDTAIKAYHVVMPFMILVGIGLLLLFGLNKKNERYCDAIKKGEALSKEDNKEEVINVKEK